VSLIEILPDWSAPEIWLTLNHPPYEQLQLGIATCLMPSRHASKRGARSEARRVA